MRKKVEANEYPTFDSFEEDFYFVWHNATIYNQKDTIYYRAAVRIKEAGMVSVADLVYYHGYVRGGGGGGGYASLP